MLKIALLALTLSADGELPMQVTETNDWVENAMQYERSAQLYKATGVEAVETVCGEHDLPLSEIPAFAAPAPEPFRFRMTIGQNGRFRIDPLGERQSCTLSNDWPNRASCPLSGQTVDLERYACF
ncbi:hypothetical protein [Falsiruegeria mediterranea]|nr:hypothetical protein [Falsiruegeria mediterranea]